MKRENPAGSVGEVRVLICLDKIPVLAWPALLGVKLRLGATLSLPRAASILASL